MPVQREHLDNEKKMACRAVSRLNEADFHKPGIYRSGRVWAHAWDVFPRMPSRVGRGRRAAVDFVVCFGWGGFFSVCFSFFVFVFFFERTRPAASMRPSCLSYLPTSTEARSRERSDRGLFFLQAKSLFIPGLASYILTCRYEILCSICSLITQIQPRR